MTNAQTLDAVREAVRGWFLTYEQDIQGRWQIRHHGKHVEYIKGGDRDSAYSRLEALQWDAILLALTGSAGEDSAVKTLSDALQDIITLGQKVHLRGELRPGKLVPIEVVNMSTDAAREALYAVGIRVRKTGNI